MPRTTPKTSTQNLDSVHRFQSSYYSSSDAQALRRAKEKSRGWFDKQSDDLMRTLDARIGVPLMGVVFSMMLSCLLVGPMLISHRPVDWITLLLIVVSSVPFAYSVAILGNWMRRKLRVERSTRRTTELAFQEFDDWMVRTYGLRPVSKIDAATERESSHIFGRMLLGYYSYNAFPVLLRSVGGDFEAKATIHGRGENAFEVYRGQPEDLKSSGYSHFEHNPNGKHFR